MKNIFKKKIIFFLLILMFQSPLSLLALSPKSFISVYPEYSSYISPFSANIFSRNGLWYDFINAMKMRLPQINFTLNESLTDNFKIISASEIQFSTKFNFSDIIEFIQQIKTFFPDNDFLNNLDHLNIKGFIESNILVLSHTPTIEVICRNWITKINPHIPASLQTKIFNILQKTLLDVAVSLWRMLNPGKLISDSELKKYLADKSFQYFNDNSNSEEKQSLIRFFSINFLFYDEKTNNVSLNILSGINHQKKLFSDIIDKYKSRLNSYFFEALFCIGYKLSMKQLEFKDSIKTKNGIIKKVYDLLKLNISGEFGLNMAELKEQLNEYRKEFQTTGVFSQNAKEFELKLFRVIEDTMKNFHTKTISRSLKELLEDKSPECFAFLVIMVNVLYELDYTVFPATILENNKLYPEAHVSVVIKSINDALYVEDILMNEATGYLKDIISDQNKAELINSQIADFYLKIQRKPLTSVLLELYSPEEIKNKRNEAIQNNFSSSVFKTHPVMMIYGSFMPFIEAGYYNREASFYENLKQYDKALELIEGAVKIIPNDPYYLRNRGVIYEKLGNLDKALESYQAALDINPSFPLFLNSYGACLMKKGKMYYKTAKEYFQKAFEINPNDELTLMNLLLISEEEIRTFNIQPLNDNPHSSSGIGISS